MSYALLFAFLSPLMFGLSNVVDKYIIGRHVKDVLAFTSVTGIISVVAGAAAFPFVTWTGATPYGIFIASLVGISMGLQFFFYMLALEKEDVSNVIGLAYLYPVLVAVMAYLLLHERIPFIGYVGMMITIAGASLLSLRLQRLSLRASVKWLVIIILLAAIGEFLIKVSTDTMGVWQGIIVSTIAMGVTLLCGLLFSSIRKNARSELRNIWWCVLSDMTLFAAIAFSFFAMEGLPATIVTSIAAVQPLLVLFMERTIHAYTGDMARDTLLLPKLGAITLIVLGVVLLSFAA